MRHDIFKRLLANLKHNHNLPYFLAKIIYSQWLLPWAMQNRRTIVQSNKYIPQNKPCKNNNILNKCNLVNSEQQHHTKNAPRHVKKT